MDAQPKSRSGHIDLRFSLDELESIKAAAKLDYLSASAWAKRTLLLAAEGKAGVVHAPAEMPT
jgi:hypothetical protein